MKGNEALAEAAKLAPLEHSFTFIADPTTDLVLPTCTEPGHTVYTCANGCGAKQSTAGTADEVSPLGHTYNRVGSTVVYVVKEESTCCKEGFKIAQCQDCQHEATVEEYTANEDLKQVIATIAHFTGKGGDDYIELTYHEADCENDSYWDVKCALDPNCTYGTGNNGEAVATRKGSNFVEALDHEWEIYTAVLTDGNPTCLTEGEWRYLCTRCDVYLMGSEAAKNGISGTELLAKGYTVDKNGDALKENLTGDAVKHKLGECVVQPTCYSRGIFACTVCPRRDVVNYEDDIDYDYHTNNEIGHTRVIEVVDPTCHSVGYTVYGCDHDEKCPYTEKDSYVAMANHTFKPVTLDGVLVCTECNKAYRDVTSAVWQSETKDFCICGTCDENKVMCGASVGASGSTYPKAPDTIVAGVANTFNLVDGDDGKYIAENIGKGIIEINGVTGASFTVKIYNGDTDVSGETLVKLTVTADENGKAYLFLYDVDSVTKVEITTEVEGSTVSFYAVKEEF